MEKLPFQPIRLEDKTLITAHTIPSNYQNCDYSFANICSWRFLYDTEFAIVDGLLLIRFWIENKTRVAYMTPTGQGNLQQALEWLEADSLEQGHPLCLLGVTPDARTELEKAAPGSFVYIPERDYFDYIYLREDLATLKGKKLQAKRNHINRFVEAWPSWYTRPVTVHNLHVCAKLAEKWYESHHESAADRRALTKALEHFEALEFEGIILYAEEGRPVGFDLGNRISADTFDVNFEKAFAEIQGAYPLVNREFARYIREKHPDIRYLNREDDMGIEGLRKAKESYYPIFLEKYIATEKEAQP